MRTKHISTVLILTAAISLVVLSGCSSAPGADLQVSGPADGADLSSANDLLNNLLPGEDQAADPASDAAQIGDDETDPGTGSDSAFLIQTRQVPDDFDWQALPVMPELSENVLAIYQHGIALGREPTNFSVIGDCQAIPFVFMGPIGRNEVLPPSHEQTLWETISQFEDSFLHESTSVRGGFTAASILNPMQADPQLCKPGETPLACEFRLHDPAFIFITLETWADPETIERYETYLRGILEYVIQQGTVPILITKADVAEVRESIHIINPAIAKIAYEYDVPLVNFWRAAQSLPNRGIDPEREGFHLSEEGFDLKNLLALQALALVTQKIETDLGIEQETNAATGVGAQPAVTPESDLQVPEVTILANPECAGGCIFFGLAESTDGDVELQGVFAYDHAQQALVQILPAGFDLQDIHPDGNRLLVNHNKFLFALDLEVSSSELISDNLYWLGEQSAYWAGSGSESTVIQIDVDTPYQGDTGRAIGLFPASRGQTVYFESGSCDSKNFCTIEGVYQQLPDQAPALLDNPLRTVFSPDGNWYASLDPDAATVENGGNLRYFLLQDPNTGSSSRRIVYLPTGSGFRVFPGVRAYAFSPNSDQLFIFYDYYSSYFEKSIRFETYLLELGSAMTLHEYGDMIGNYGTFKPKLVWSPDGQKVLFFLTDNPSGEEYSLSVYKTIIGTEDRLIPYSLNIYSSQNYFYITNIGWQKP
jgi:hypothetical protein